MWAILLCFQEFRVNTYDTISLSRTEDGLFFFEAYKSFVQKSTTATHAQIS